ALPVRGGSHTDHRLVEPNGCGGPEKARVAEREDPAVGGNEPVAVTVGGGGHAHDWLVEAQRSGGAEEARVAEAEHAAIGGHEPVAAQCWIRERHALDRRLG